jgi:hypothetical protein
VNRGSTTNGSTERTVSLGPGPAAQNPGVLSSAPSPTGQYPGVLSAAPSTPGETVPRGVPPVVAQVPTPTPRPTPGVLPFAGEIGPGTLTGIFGSLGLIGVGVGVQLRARLNAARRARLAAAEDPGTSETSTSGSQDDPGNDS